MTRNDKLFFNPNSRTRLQLPQPVQRLDSRDASGSSSGPNAPGEHALRRKTPNGTLAAGYDGTPSDITIQPPATKHILVSSLDSGQFTSPPAGIQTENWQQSALDQSAAPKHMNFPPVFKNDAAGGNAVPAGEVVQDVNGTSWVRPVNFTPGIDSVLNQSLPLQHSQRFYLQNGAYVPTVLPATLQGCIGPTASAGTGPFGPYWPDGVYIPYRPVAFRDSRFNSPTSLAKQLDPTGQSFYDLNQPAFNQPQIPLGGGANSGFAWGQTTSGMPAFPPRHSDQLSFNARANRPVSAFSSQPLNNEPITYSGRPVHGFQTPGPAVAANVEFKEKILSWAHGVYVDLLATIHQARRNSISNGGTEGQNHRFLKPSIYPKPPRQPGLDFSSQTTTPEVHRHNSLSDLQAQKLHPLANSRSAHSTPFSQGNSHSRRPSLAYHSKSDTSGRFSGASPASRFSGSLLNEGSPVANAVSALEMLSHLCMESRWEWIDGMLLGGCLAYGLGDYLKAMRWYNRIIARDST